MRENYSEFPQMDFFNDEPDIVGLSALKACTENTLTMTEKERCRATDKCAHYFTTNENNATSGA